MPKPGEKEEKEVLFLTPCRKQVLICTCKNEEESTSQFELVKVRYIETPIWSGEEFRVVDWKEDLLSSCAATWPGNPDTTWHDNITFFCEEDKYGYFTANIKVTKKNDDLKGYMISS